MMFFTNTREDQATYWLFEFGSGLFTVIITISI